MVSVATMPELSPLTYAGMQSERRLMLTLHSTMESRPSFSLQTLETLTRDFPYLDKVDVGNRDAKHVLDATWLGGLISSSDFESLLTQVLYYLLARLRNLLPTITSKALPAATFHALPIMRVPAVLRNPPRSE
ncbi:hypothetical protein CKAN_01410700 [Cinnamomum micranthum f. kanehirae]|uniref:Uncharacterized protein n=1 Tax=Cinnamomum micranthum f. kanehirae TaxID=337451 RepID=A0A3S3MZ87_9MAGN|nr:hypothetical protein CKAN_01410700 [Cinnamomum micranthum f. kanehirae]